MKFTTFILLFTCLLWENTAKSQESWTLRKDKNGIKVFSRPTKNFKFDELKVECEIDGRLSQLAALLFDVNKQYQWAYKTIKSQLLKQVTAEDVFFYTEIEVPWPYQNRDMVVHMVMRQNPITKVLTVEAKNTDNYLPVKEDIVRLKYSNAIWTVTPVGNKKLKIDYRLQLDIGENVPAWLANLFSVNGPYESFSNLKEKIKLSAYAHATFPFIAD